jgi:hypothetical protein
MIRHAWEKLATHHYRCTRCGMDKTNVETAPGRWQAVFRRGEQTWHGATPPCHGQPLAADLPASHADWGPSNWNAYVEAGDTIQERRARLQQCPEEWRESVRAHVATVFALRDAARQRAQQRQQRRSQW